ncbi:hypothetical protein GO495_04200 [Chitinophaga oryziterrae]|uniref:SGNH/GDSL hydrolase family protein n=1 Tax=Chitinophaga oryziterrae TaxID=1031224 RepID=A0A6N8J4E2_9BACT|nr:hypothetical protein [Chitinophaga oryziterrae]MVT39774.1 hypothetical protein [Chitinophaga oryziterrae]
MNKFLTRLLLFFIILILLLLPLVFIKIGGDKLRYIDNPTAALIDKHARLDSLPSPKLIITGGSNAFYGMNSERISRELNMNVVNMGLFAGFGLDFMLNELEGRIHANDKVVLSIEYFLTSKCSAEEDILKYYPSASAYLHVKEPFYTKWINDVKINIESVQNRILTPVKRSSNIYVHSRTINKFGDAVGYLTYKKPVYGHYGRLEYRHYEEIATLNRFKQRMDSVGAEVYLVFPPFPRSDFERNKDIFDRYYADLKRELKIPILGTPEGMVFDDTLFYDTVYHLDKDGREARTDRLINLLLQYPTHSGTTTRPVD